MITICLKYIALQSGPKYQKISKAIAAAIDEGHLKDGDRLPPQRELADSLGVTLGTVTRGYEDAKRRGLAHGETGRGTFIGAGESAALSLHALHNQDDRDHSPLIHFDLNYPPPDGDPDLGGLLASLNDKAALQQLLRYRPTSGIAEHRQTGARWLRLRGLNTEAQQVVITSGAQHGINISLMSSLSPGDCLAVDRFTYPGLINCAHHLQIRLFGVDADESGMRPDLLEQAVRLHPGIKGVYLIPTIHNPTTRSMPTDRRRQLAEAARKFDLLLIEDDVYGLFDDCAPPPLATIAPDRTFYLTSMSKTLSPGLRLGYLQVPDGYLASVEAAMAASIWMQAPLVAAVGSRWIEDGTALAVLRRKQRAAEERIAALAAALSGFRFDYHSGSLHGWLHLPPPWNAEDFARVAVGRGVQVIPSPRFAVGNQVVDTQAVRLCTGCPADCDEVRRGGEILADLLRRSPPQPPPLM